MSLRRLVVSAAALTGIAALLSALTPALPSMASTLSHAQRTVDTGGANALVLAAVGLVAWAVWLWGAVGLGLTALAAAPGVLGAVASVLVRIVLPAAARRTAAGLLGLSLGVAPLLGTAAVLLPTVASAAGPSAGAPASTLGTPSSSAAVPDWPSPTAPSAEVPDWPRGRPAATRPSEPHVVLRGECLWDIAAGRLSQGRPSTPTDREIARGVHAWWSANASVIGPDPDLLLPGQVLSPPTGP